MFITKRTCRECATGAVQERFQFLQATDSALFVPVCWRISLPLSTAMDGTHTNAQGR